jgi:hypothetical protein
MSGSELQVISMQNGRGSAVMYGKIVRKKKPDIKVTADRESATVPDSNKHYTLTKFTLCPCQYIW